MRGSFTDLGGGCGASSGVKVDGGAGGDGGAEFSAGAGPEDGTIDGTGAGTRELGAGVGTSEAEGTGVCEEGAGTAGCKTKKHINNNSCFRQARIQQQQLQRIASEQCAHRHR